MTDATQPNTATPTLITSTKSEHAQVDAINAVLPQTQCTKCGYSGCKPYAEAIVAGAAINRCPPGGPQTIVRLAALTGRPEQPLDPEVGQHIPQQLAVIREAECIGCTKCIQACPVDAIVGAAKLMHTVVAAECTGCDLCVEPCPVDCIDMINVADVIATPEPALSQHWRARYEARQQRLVHLHDQLQQRRLMRLQDKLAALDRGETIQREARALAADAEPPVADLAARVRQRTPEQLRADIQAAVARTRVRKQAPTPDDADNANPAASEQTTPPTDRS